MTYHWAEGSRPPKKVTADDMKAALDALPELSPKNLLAASKRKRHVLHNDLWSEGDQVWAKRARLARCRHIIGWVHEEIVVGSKTISVRAVEFVKPNGKGRWVSIESIIDDPELVDAYLAEVQNLQEQAVAKMARIRELIRQNLVGRGR